jgi:hypothetical protein
MSFSFHFRDKPLESIKIEAGIAGKGMGRAAAFVMPGQKNQSSARAARSCEIAPAPPARLPADIRVHCSLAWRLAGFVQAPRPNCVAQP